MRIEDLTEGQKLAVKKLDEFLIKKSEYSILRIYGYAGTGKTTAISSYMSDHNIDPDSIIFVAPTNKAKRVLAKKFARDGLHQYKVTTVFQLLYTWIDNPDYCSALQKAKEMHQLKKDSSNLSDDQEKEFKKLCAMTRNLDPHISARREKPEDLEIIIIDECSMVGLNDCKALEEWGIPLVVIGDKFQLPPVKESVSRLMVADPDVLLTEVKRTEDNKILKLATDIRDLKPMHPSLNNEYSKADLTVSRRRNVDAMANADMIICYTNSMVAKVNLEMHEHFHPEKGTDFPQIGEPVMFYQGNFETTNCHDDDGNDIKIERLDDFGNTYTENKTFRKPLFDNGEKCTVSCLDWHGLALIKDDDTVTLFKKFDSHLFSEFVNSMQDSSTRELSKWYFSFGYACTVHKSQGSEFDNVYIVNDYPVYKRNTIDYKRWIYTAITRAKCNLYIEGGI